MIQNRDVLEGLGQGVSARVEEEEGAMRAEGGEAPPLWEEGQVGRLEPSLQEGMCQAGSLAGRDPLHWVCVAFLNVLFFCLNATSNAQTSDIGVRRGSFFHLLLQSQSKIFSLYSSRTLMYL